MLTIDRWRNWRPPEKNYGAPTRCVPPKPPEAAFEGFEGTDLGPIPEFWDAIPPQDPFAWKDDFGRWVKEHCVRRAGYDDWGGIGTLYVDFCEWTIDSGSVPCTRRTFEALLIDAGLRMADGLVSSLFLKVDHWALEGRRGSH
jgi:hypothetical protein